jgi:hypothetical protein
MVKVELNIIFVFLGTFLLLEISVKKYNVHDPLFSGLEVLQRFLYIGFSHGAH